MHLKTFAGTVHGLQVFFTKLRKRVQVLACRYEMLLTISSPAFLQGHVVIAQGFNGLKLKEGRLDTRRNSLLGRW